MACDAITGALITIKTTELLDELHSGIATTRGAFSVQIASRSRDIRPELNLFFYDRLYMCLALLDTHKELGSRFVARCKASGTFSEITDFCKSNEVDSAYEIRGHKVRLIKATRNEVEYIYATNIFSETLTREEISWLYFKR